MKSIVLILPYFGKWPIWFEAHLTSIAKNPTVNWLIVTDCKIPDNYPENVMFVTTTLSVLNSNVNQVVEASVPLTPRKFCDLKPAYGDIFKEYIKDYDFWGFCDMDIIWGNIRKFITDDLLEKYDIISTRKDAISGHFNLFKNTSALKTFYKQIPQYQELFEKSEFMWFDEIKLTDYIKQKMQENKFEYQIFWNTILLNQERGVDSHQEYYLDRWLWEEGKMINTNTKEEVMYLHFINWKRTMKKCEVSYENNTQNFYISFSGIHYLHHSTFEIINNDIANFYNGYYKKESRRILKKKLNSFLKRIKRKIKIRE